MSEAARVLGIDSNLVWSRLVSNKSKYKDWYYTDGLPVPRALEERRTKTRRTVQWVAYTFMHLPSGCAYVGMTGYFVYRRAQHLSQLRNNKHPSRKLQELWNNDPVMDNWKWSAVICPTKDQAFELEQGEMDIYPPEKLLNNVLNARSPISHHMAHSEVIRRQVEGWRQWLRDNGPAYSQRVSKQSLERWARPGAKEAIQGAGNPNAKPVEIDGVKYDGVKAAAEQLSISPKTVFNRVRSAKFPTYRFLDRGKGPTDDPYARRAVT
jgi:hypothetical protein